jgi:TRAP-type C4-dicarboxylate transport system substrate-binding protein
LSLALVLPGAARTASAKDGAGKDTYIRLATLAPRSSDLVRGFVKIDKGLRKATGGKWGIKLYPSGIAGDEKDVIRKIRVGQMDGTAVTSVGLSQVLRELAVLTAPGAIESYQQLERVQQALNKEWEAKLEAEGFRLVGWGEIGMLRYFSNAPVHKPSDLKNMRPWVWPEAHTMKATWHAIGCTGVPLGVPEVYGALQTRMIDAIISTAIAVVALQWHAKLSYVTERTHGPLVGGMVISTEKWNSLPAEVQAALSEQISSNYQGDNLQIRKDDLKAYKKLTKRGYQAVPYTKEGEAEYQRIAKQSRESLVGRVYSKELLERVMRVARGG